MLHVGTHPLKDGFCYINMLISVAKVKTIDSIKSYNEKQRKRQRRAINH